MDTLPAEKAQKRPKKGPIWNQSGREGFSLVTSASFCIEHLEPEER